MIVLDASVAVSWRLNDEPRSPVANAVADRLSAEQGVVPLLFWYEVRSVLMRYEFNGRIPYGQTEELLLPLERLNLTLDFSHDEAVTLALARKHRLNVYDASYLETALRRGAELATFDDRLANAARREGVPNPAG